MNTENKPSVPILTYVIFIGATSAAFFLIAKWAGINLSEATWSSVGWKGIGVLLVSIGVGITATAFLGGLMSRFSQNYKTFTEVTELNDDELANYPSYAWQIKCPACHMKNRVRGPDCDGAQFTCGICESYLRVQREGNKITVTALARVYNQNKS